MSSPNVKDKVRYFVRGLIWKLEETIAPKPFVVFLAHEIDLLEEAGKPVLPKYVEACKAIAGVPLSLQLAIANGRGSA